MDNDNKVDSMQDLDSSLTQKMKELQTKQPGKNQKIRIFSQESNSPLNRPKQMVSSSKGGDAELQHQSSQSSGDLYLDSELSKEDTPTQEEKIGPQSFHPIQILGKGSFGEVYLV